MNLDSSLVSDSESDSSFSLLHVYLLSVIPILFLDVHTLLGSSSTTATPAGELHVSHTQNVRPRNGLARLTGPTGCSNPAMGKCVSDGTFNIRSRQCLLTHRVRGSPSSSVYTRYDYEAGMRVRMVRRECA